MHSDLYGYDVKSHNSKGQVGNVVTFKIMIFNCAVKITNREENQLNISQILFYNYCEF